MQSFFIFLQTIIHMVKSRNQRVIAVAFTGIAASLMDGGQTANSRFKLKLKLDKDSVSNIIPNSDEARYILSAELLIWDEAPTCSMHMVNCVDRLYRDLTRNWRTPFGGKIVLFGGDFMQPLPITPLASPMLAAAVCFKKTKVWLACQVIVLETNMRALAEEIEFAQFLLDIGRGRAPTVDGDSLIRVPDQCVDSGYKYFGLIDHIWGHGDIDIATLRDSNKAILTPTNEDALEINEQVLDRIPGDPVMYISADRILQEELNEADVFPIEYVHTMTPSGMPPHHLNLKIGCVVMLLRNIFVAEGLCNGTRMIVESFDDDTITGRIMFGSKKGRVFTLPRIAFETEENSPVQFRRLQIPVRLAFAITINKSQGQTLEKVGLYLRQPVFAHGQLYVAMSRVRSFANIKVRVEDIIAGNSRQGYLTAHNGTYTKNVVLREVLTRKF